MEIPFPGDSRLLQDNRAHWYKGGDALRQSHRELREGKSQPGNETLLRALNSQYLLVSVTLTDISIRLSYAPMPRKGKVRPSLHWRIIHNGSHRRKDLELTHSPRDLPVSNPLSIRIMKESPHLPWFILWTLPRYEWKGFPRINVD